MSLLDGVAWQGKVFSGGWTGGSGESYPVVSPSTGEVLATMGRATPADVGRAAARAPGGAAGLGRGAVQRAGGSAAAGR